jgi:hypothetical protein
MSIIKVKPSFEHVKWERARDTLKAAHVECGHLY